MLQILAAVALSAAPKLQLQNLAPADQPDGCGCTIADGKKVYFFSDIDDGRPIILLDGQRLKLEKGKTTKPEKKPKVGDTFFEEFSAQGVDVRVDHTVTFVCKDGDESCEVARFKATVTVKRDGQQRVYKNLKADCGC